MNCDDKVITLIRGDAFTLLADLYDIDRSVIQAVWFSSHSLGVQKEMTPADGGEGAGGRWSVSIPSAQTRDFPVGGATYDITITLAGGNRITPVHNAYLRIAEKENEVTGGG